MVETQIDKGWQGDYVDLIMRRANRRLTLAKGRVRDLMQEDFPSTGPVILGHLFLDLIDALIVELELIKGELPQWGAEGVVREVVNLMDMALRLLEDVRILEQASIGCSQWAVVEPLESLMQDIHPESNLVLSATSLYGYSYDNLIERFERLVAKAFATRQTRVERVREIYEVYPRYLVHVGFPTEEQQEVLLCAGWAHELGHFINSVRHVSAPLEGDLVGDLSELQAWPHLGMTKKRLLTNMASMWAEEIVSDVLAVRLFGPATIFAISSVILPQALLGDATIYHPPFWLRLQAMLKVARRLGYRDLSLISGGGKGQCQREIQEDEGMSVAQSVDSALKGSYEWLEAKSIRPEPAVVVTDETWKEDFELVLAMLEERISDAVDIALQVDGGWLYSADIYIDEVYPLVERLVQGVVPNEILRPRADDQGGEWTPVWFRSILNAGWAYYLTSAKGIWHQASEEAGSESEVDDDVESALNDILFKAIELSRFQLHFRERTEL